jgi:CBS domain-containing protein
MDQKAFEIISKMPHFSFLPEDERRNLAQEAREVSYEKDHLYATQGESKIEEIFVVTNGSLVLLDDRSGERKKSGYIKKGEVFGGISILMNGGVSLRTVVIEKRCTGYAIPKALFESLCTRYKEFFFYFIENFSDNVFDESLEALIETGQIVFFLSNLEPFSFLPKEEIERVAAHIQAVHHDPGAVIYVQGRSRVGYLYIIQEGSAERYFEKEGQKTMLDILGEGEMYGGISILVNDGISVRTMRVVEPTNFYLLPTKIFQQLCHKHPAFSEFFTDIFGRRMMERSYASIISKTRRSWEGDGQFFNRPVVDVCSLSPVFGRTEQPIRDIAQLMLKENASAIFLKSAKDDVVGLVTEQDLAQKVLAAGLGPDQPVSKIMSSPLQTIAWNAPTFEAYLDMLKGNIRHLGVTDADEMVMGILSDRSLLMAQGQSPLFMFQEIGAAESVSELAEIYRRLPPLIRGMISAGAKASNLTRFISAVADTILKKVMNFTLRELGDPPVPFVFMVLGSEGRMEQTLKTDQDNAIVFENVSEKELPDVRAYFLKYGELACGMLDEIGYDFCTGGVMAKNPQWCQPIAVWQNYFSEWIHAAKAKDLLHSSIFFDFRCGYGKEALVEDLRQSLFALLKGWSGFFRHLTENALYFKPPLGFFRNFVVESKGEHRSKFDIKGAMMPVTDLARILALKHLVEETNTLDRLHHLQLMEVLADGQYDELERMYSFLMQLRFARQVSAILDENKAPDNYINTDKLTGIEQKMLKEIFRRIEQFQSRLEFEFIGIV